MNFRNKAADKYADLKAGLLWGATLQGAMGINKFLLTPLYILLDQPGSIRAYKIVKASGEGIYNSGINYLATDTFEVACADTDETNDCGAGINLATLDWCLKEWKTGYRILIMEFLAADIACIPIASDGKFRVFRCKRVGEKNVAPLGIIEEDNVDAPQATS